MSSIPAGTPQDAAAKPARLGPRGVPLYTRTHTPGVNTDELAGTEWLLTNGSGGFAMGTALGVPSRRYHGLLVASLKPPVQRVMTLSAVAESLLIDPDTLNERRYDLSAFRFRPGELHPRGDQLLTRFEKDVSCRWTWVCDGVTVIKELTLVRGSGPGAALVSYTVKGATKPARLMLRPLVAMRDFHGLTLRDTVRDRLSVKHGTRGLIVQGTLCQLHIGVSTGEVAPVEQWWYNFQYDLERDRGYDYLEDLYHPGSFVVDFAPAASSSVTLTASVNAPLDRDAGQTAGEAVERATGLLERARSAVGGVGQHNDDFSALALAADDFIVARAPLPSSQPARPTTAGKSEEPVTLVAGYPWFVDWGRDAAISLPGLMLMTGRAPEARRLLSTFAAHTLDGLVPNVFDDYSGQPHFNTVDASLWFVHACCEYLRATGDKAAFTRDLLPACLGIVKAYREGTHFGIRMDPADGLITAGDHTTQLTWMDAKRDGVVFTPRHGKAVEINALWHNALAGLVEAAGTERPALKSEFSALAARVREQFARLFVRPDGGLYDVLSPGEGGAWTPSPQVRPNQLLAASLRHGPLTRDQRRAVVALVRSRLLTPLGLRTLDPADPGYKGRFRGRMFERDAAYHNGTVWPWLLGPYAEAVLRAGDFTPAACREARAAIAPIIDRIGVDCPGQIAEVFDGDDTPEDPRRPGGCPAQAWSIAEPLRVLALIIKAERGVKGL